MFFKNFSTCTFISSYTSIRYTRVRTPDTKQFSVDKQCSLITSVSNFCYHYQNLLQFTKITTRIHVFWPCLKLHNWCFWSNSTLLSFCAPYRCKHKCLWGICIYSDMEHIHGRQARRSFCSRYRCKYNYPYVCNVLMSFFDKFFILSFVVMKMIRTNVEKNSKSTFSIFFLLFLSMVKISMIIATYNLFVTSKNKFSNSRFLSAAKCL